MTTDLSENSAEAGIDVQRLVLLLESVERHLLEIYGDTVSDFECARVEEEGWNLCCEVKAAKDRILKPNNIRSPTL